KRLLVLGGDPAGRETLIAAIGSRGIRITSMADAGHAIAALRAGSHDGLVVDLGSPASGGLDLLEAMVRGPALGIPSIVYSARPLDRTERTRLARIGHRVIGGGSQAMAQLVRRTHLVLHRMDSALPDDKRALIEASDRCDISLAGTRALVV